MSRRFTLLTALLFLLALAGCSASGAASPEAAATQRIAESIEDGVVNDLQSIEALQQQSFGDSVYVVLSYRRMWNNRDETCLVAYETYQQPLRGWFSPGGSGSCTNNRAEPSATGLKIFGGTQIGQDPGEPDVSFVLGWANDDRIVKVDISWSDGYRQLAEVENGTVLAIREGEAQVKSTVSLTESGEPVDVIRR